MNRLRTATFSLLLLVSASASAEVFSCQGADGKRVYTDQPCASTLPKAAARPDKPSPAIVSPPPAQAATPHVPKYARDEIKVNKTLTPAQQQDRERSLKAYVDESRIAIKENMRGIKSACQGGDAKACTVLKDCEAKSDTCGF